MDTLPMIPKEIGIKPLPKTQRQLKVIGNLAKRKDVDGAIIATMPVGKAKRWVVISLNGYGLINLWNVCGFLLRRKKRLRPALPS